MPEVVKTTGILEGIITFDDILDLLAEQISNLATLVQREQQLERRRRQQV